jgi:hypothetical protein
VNELCDDMRSGGAQCLDDLGPHLIVKAPTAWRQGNSRVGGGGALEGGIGGKRGTIGLPSN